MSAFAQHDRLLKINTRLGEDVLLLTHFDGEEKLSSGYQYQLRVLAQKHSADIDALLGKPVSVSLCEKGGAPRYFHGRISQIKEGNQEDPLLPAYHFRIVPWWWFLSLSSDCRIFQHQSVVDIFKTVCREHGFADYDLSGLRKTYSPIDYCVQYNETHQHFLQRLLDAAGIYYYFQQAQNKHTMRLVDCFSALIKERRLFTVKNNRQHSPYLSDWQSCESCQASQFSLSDYNFQTPAVDLFSSQNDKKDVSGMKEMEQFIYPGAVSTKMAGTCKLKQMADSLKWANHTCRGESDYLQLQAGLRFDLADDEIGGQSGEYYIESIDHRAHDVTHLSGDGATASAPQFYHNTITCIRDLYPYCPSPEAQKPVMPSVQTAKVVGDYVDQLGRVNVQFHWDRFDKNKAHSRAWLRVLQGVAGKQFGTQFMAHTGQEVIVQFIHGDPNRPLVAATLRNADHLSAYLLPDEQNLLGFNGYSPKNKKTGPGHEIKFDDTPGQENLVIKSQKALVQIVAQDCVEQIEDGEKTIIGRNQLVDILRQAGKWRATRVKLQVGSSQLFISRAGVVIQSSAVKIQAKDVGALQPAARLGDHHQCPDIHPNGSPHVGGPIISGSETVTINQLPAACQGDKAQCHDCVDTIIQGAQGLLINGKPAAKLNDKLAHGGRIITGSSTVLWGEAGSMD
jgi:type VI secretion system secreted protein VgrG